MGDDDVGNMLRTLRDSAERQRRWKRLEDHGTRVLNPFYGTWLRPWTVKKRRGHVQWNRLVGFVFWLTVVGVLFLLLVL